MATIASMHECFDMDMRDSTASLPHCVAWLWLCLLVFVKQQNRSWDSMSTWQILLLAIYPFSLRGEVQVHDIHVDRKFCWVRHRYTGPPNYKLVYKPMNNICIKNQSYCSYVYQFSHLGGGHFVYVGMPIGSHYWVMKQCYKFGSSHNLCRFPSQDRTDHR